MLVDAVVRFVAFLVGIFVVVNSFAKLIFPTKTKEFVSRAPTFKFYVVSGCINLLMASLLIYLAVQGKLVDIVSYAVIAVAIMVAVIGVAEMIFAPKFKEWFVGGSIFYVGVSACIGLLVSSLLIYLAV